MQYMCPHMPILSDVVIGTATSGATWMVRVSCFTVVDPAVKEIEPMLLFVKLCCGR